MYRKTVLDNGVRIVSEQLEHYRSVSLGIWVNAGSRDEQRDENGIAHFIEHMIFKGTEKRTSLDIAKELDVIGGLSNAFTGKENTCFHSRVLDKHFGVLADILSDIFLNSTFDPQEVERERQVILQEIHMVEDTPDELIHDLFNRLLWVDHTLGSPVLGTAETVNKIEQRAILSYMERFYTPKRVIVAAAGNVDHDRLVDYFHPLFGKIGHHEQPPSTYSHTRHSDILCQQKPLEQAHLCLGGEAPHLKSERRFAGAVFNTILGGNMSSRLFQEIREKRGLAYSVFSYINAYQDTGVLGVYAATNPLAVNHVLEVIQSEVKKLQEGGLSEADLIAVKEHLVGGILLNSESTDSRMMRLAKNEYLFERYVSFDELVGGIEKVSIGDVIAVANDTFHREAVSLVTLGPIAKEDLDLSTIQFH
jgi:predicted Zn-dependent peptidase